MCGPHGEPTSLLDGVAPGLRGSMGSQLGRNAVRSHFRTTGERGGEHGGLAADGLVKATALGLTLLPHLIMSERPQDAVSSGF